MKRLIVLAIVPLFILFTLSFAVAVAQEEPTPEPTPGDRTAPTAPNNETRLVIETKDKTSPAMKGLKPAGEFRRRLPNGFAALVNTTQREEVYKIQEEYYELIALLELRVELLKQERDVKIDAVLTPAQQERLNRPVRRTILPR